MNGVRLRGLLLATLGVVCAVVWGRNYSLLSGHNREVRPPAESGQQTTTSVPLPVAEDFDQMVRDPFARFAPPPVMPEALSSAVQAEAIAPPRILPYEFVGRIDSKKRKKPILLLRNVESGIEEVVSVADSVAGFALESVKGDTLFFKRGDERALVVARTP